jgi:hypothetical protein
MVLVPSSSSMLDDKNWYFPTWLKWIPRIEIDASITEATPVEDSARLLPHGLPAAGRSGLVGLIEKGVYPSLDAFAWHDGRNDSAQTVCAGLESGCRVEEGSER